MAVDVVVFRLLRGMMMSEVKWLSVVSDGAEEPKTHAAIPHHH